MNFREKRIMIDEILSFAKKSKLNDEQKNRLLDFINSLNNITETQKERFIMYYGIGKYNPKKLTEIANIYGTTINAIRCSVVSVRNKLIRVKENINIIEEIYNNSK